MFSHFYTGLPLHEVGKGSGGISRKKSKNNSRAKGVGGSSTRSSKRKKKNGKRKKHQSDSESDSEWKPWMEAQIHRKKIKSKFLYCSVL